MNNLYVFLAQQGLNSFILIFGLCIWKIVWVDNFDNYVPKGNIQSDCQSFLHNRKEVYKAEGFRDIISLMFKAISDFHPKYWIENIGFDGYCYLYLQRKFLQFLGQIILLGCLIWGAGTLLYSLNLNPYIYYYIDSIFLPYKLSIFMFTISALFINKLIYIRKHLQNQLIDTLFGKTSSKGVDWMKLRTIMVEGVPLNDLNGEMLRHKIDNDLQDEGKYANVDQVMIIPAYSRMLKLIQKLRDLETGQQVMHGEVPFLRKIFLKLCVPRKYLDKLSFENKKISIKQKIEQETKKKYSGSGYAIVNFESIEAAKFCLEKYSPNKTFLQVAFEAVKNCCTKCCTSTHISRARTQSIDSDMLANYKDFSIICYEIPDPADIAWLNLEGELRGIQFWRRILINIFFIFMLLFFSTPAAIFAFIQKYFRIDFFQFGWTDYIPKPFGPLLKLYLPALVIVMLNQVVILFIDLVTYQEKFQRHSVFQISIFRKYYLYLIFNVVIVPAFFMASQDSLYEILMGNIKVDFRQAFDRLYTSDHGMVYSIIISQSAAVSVFVYINRIGDLVMNYFSPYLTYHKRIFQNDDESYLRTGDEVFQYGYFYSQMLMVLSIVLQFMLSSGWVLGSGYLYFFLRHCLDSYLLLTIHTREIESSGLMVNSALRYAMIGVFLFQIQFLIDFYLKQDWYQMVIAGILIMFSFIIFFILRQPLFKIDLIKDDQIDYARYNRTEIKHEWRKLYKHPLILNPSASSSSKEIRKTGFKLNRPNPSQNKGDKVSIKSSRQSSNQNSKLSSNIRNQQRNSQFSQNQQSQLTAASSNKQIKSKFSQVKNGGFATDTDNGINTREDTEIYYNSKQKLF
ncbi:transmembrane protein, putative (macronuclear) [Tetrahymena thermophila SB210]|uniref:Transmembrane protein, putative n=1 Tax=Tetrahymena thermophila (strain SB210) TaxID=312017 RepID=Q234H4_TETTS|nr:transmembrane protein, putative [Tetrahymena thermophila SB210]EAR92029.2 transmembrane protein, putative [Tetrahymena thermophila SB210]|eukprot:XP_001012274.2 transmembrane protein, putative [Tetrahymena thermophila SB210]